MRPILFLAPRLPLPADTGAKIRALNLLRQLRSQFQLHLVCPGISPEDRETSKQLQQEGLEVTLVPLRPSPLVYLNGLVPGRPPIAVAKYASRRLGRTLEELARSRAYAAVHCDHAHMAQYQGRLPDLPWVLDEHNVEYLILERLARLQTNPLRRWLVADQARRWRHFEREVVARSAKVLAVSTPDADVLRNFGTGTPIEVVPNGVDTSFFDESAVDPGSTDLVFTGSMDWWPNQDAATYFAREILPRIRRECPDARFVIVGRAPTAGVRRLAQEDGSVLVTGAVEDVRPYLRQAAAVVVPIRVGGGTRLKILEAMAAGRAVVSTTVGAEGIECVPGEQIVLADTPEEFASAVVALLADHSRRGHLGRSARRFAADRYDWGAIGERLLASYGTIGSIADPKRPS